MFARNKMLSGPQSECCIPFLEKLEIFKSLKFIVAGSGREGVAAQCLVTLAQKGQAP